MIAKNLLNLRKHLSLAQNEFSLKLGINPRAYINYERGERKPPYEMLIKLSEDFNVNLNWLIAGKGEMFNNSAAEFEQQEDKFTAKVEEILKKKGLI